MQAQASDIVWFTSRPSASDTFVLYSQLFYAVAAGDLFSENKRRFKKYMNTIHRRRTDFIYCTWCTVVPLSF